MKKAILLLCITAITLLSCENNSTENTENKKSKYTDEYTLVGEKNFYTGYEAMNTDSTFNAVIEIPAGTTQKWMVDVETGNIIWEYKNGKPRIVNYLAYPCNYGIIPRTILLKEKGGDGDPVDVLVLGPALERGTIIKVQVIGVMKLLDGGEVDDKLICVFDGTPFYNFKNLNDLEEQYHGVSTILSTWFANYKGKNVMEYKGYDSREAALEFIKTAIEDFEK